MNAQDGLVGNYLWEKFDKMECDWMTSHSTGILAGSDLDQAGNASEVRTEGSHPTLGPLDNAGSLIFNILGKKWY